MTLHQRQAKLRTAIKKLLPKPVRKLDLDDGEVFAPDDTPLWRFAGGDPGEVIVTATRDELSVSIFSVRWDGPHTPRIHGNPLSTVAWSDLPADSKQALEVIGHLIEAARTIRVAAYEKCEICGEVNPPEWMGKYDDRIACHGCAEQHLGVVH
jgi:hypothetical protein